MSNQSTTWQEQRAKYWAFKHARQALQASNSKYVRVQKFLYEATFQKWTESIVVDGRPVKIEKEGYRTYSPGPHNIGRNKLKRELKAAQRLRRHNRLRVVSTALLYNVPKIKLTMKAFVNA